MIEPPTYMKMWENDDALRLTLNEDRAAVWSNIYYSMKEAEEACGKPVSTRLDFHGKTEEFYLVFFELEKFFELEEERIAAAQRLANHFLKLGWVTIPDELMAALFPSENTIEANQAEDVSYTSSPGDHWEEVSNPADRRDDLEDDHEDDHMSWGVPVDPDKV